jgi:hypothetical protein
LSSENEVEKQKTVLDVAPDSDQAPAEETSNQVELVADGKIFMLRMPVAIGKMGAYGALEMMRDEVSKFFYIMERKAREEEHKSKSILQRLHIPGVRTH